MTPTKTLKSVCLYRYDILENGLPGHIEDWAPYLQNLSEYNEAGLLTREVSYNTWGENEQIVEYSYTANGQVAEERFYDEGDEVTEFKTYVRDEKGEVLKELHRYLDETEDVVEYQYDDDNNLLRRVYFDSDGEEERRDEYDYQDGLLLKETVSDAQGNLISQSTYTYNEEKKIEKTEMIKIEDGKSERLVSHFDENGNRKKTLKYNYQEQLIEINRFHFDENGSLQEIEEENQHGKSLIKFNYDEKGNVVFQEELNEKGDVISTINRKYDEEGRILETIVSIDGRNFRPNQNYILKYEYKFFD